MKNSKVIKTLNEKPNLEILFHDLTPVNNINVIEICDCEYLYARSGVEGYWKPLIGVPLNTIDTYRNIKNKRKVILLS